MGKAALAMLSWLEVRPNPRGGKGRARPTLKAKLTFWFATQTQYTEFDLYRMNMAWKSVVTYAALLAVILTGAGCFSPGGSKTTPASNPDKPVSFAVIYVTTTTNAGGNFGEAGQHLNDAIISRLIETEMFTTVTNQAPDPSLGQGIKIAVAITRLKKVSAEARNWTGILAGRAGISMQLDITDLQSGRPIQSFEVEAKSGRAAYGSTTDEAIDRAAKEVVNRVLKLNAQSAEGERL